MHRLLDPWDQDPFGVPLGRTLRRFAFWTAVALPFVILVFLVAGVETPFEVGLFAGLVVLDGVAVIVGHEYNRDSASERFRNRTGDQ